MNKEQVIVIGASQSLMGQLQEKFTDIEFKFTDIDSLGDDLVKMETRVQSVLSEITYLQNLNMMLQQHHAVQSNKLKKFAGDIEARATLPRIEHDMTLISSALMKNNSYIVDLFEARFGKEFKFLKPKPKSQSN